MEPCDDTSDMQDDGDIETGDIETENTGIQVSKLCATAIECRAKEHKKETGGKILWQRMLLTGNGVLYRQSTRRKTN